jgi:hypothetical protein
VPKSAKDPQDLFAGLAQQRQRKEQRPQQSDEAIVMPDPEVPPRKGRARGKRSNADYTQVGAYIPKTLKKQVDRLLVDEDETDFSDLVTQLLQVWVSSKANK